MVEVGSTTVTVSVTRVSTLLMLVRSSLSVIIVVPFPRNVNVSKIAFATVAVTTVVPGCVKVTGMTGTVIVDTSPDIMTVVAFPPIP